MNGRWRCGSRRWDRTLRKEDGLLTAEEVATLDLSSVGLTVLSLCNTGLGLVTVGEGVFGLRRALEIAGSKSMVMSLWPIPDRQARRWMMSFYTAWIEGRPVDDAARRASLDLLADLRRREVTPHPFLWGGLVTAGDWQSAVIPPPQSQTSATSWGRTHPRTFLSELRPPVILDEIQNAPELLSDARAAIDRAPAQERATSR